LSLEKNQEPPLNMYDETRIESLQFKGRVLVVEDSEINRVVVSEILTSYGVDVELANDGMQAIEAIKQSHFDMIFMDL
jgi:CheY-like chemotaxis protein